MWVQGQEALSAEQASNSEQLRAHQQEVSQTQVRPQPKTQLSQACRLSQKLWHCFSTVGTVLFTVLFVNCNSAVTALTVTLYQHVPVSCSK